MDLMYPQSGIAIPGLESRGIVLPPFPGKKVVSVSGFFFRDVNVPAFSDQAIITNTDNNVMYKLRIIASVPGIPAAEIDNPRFSITFNNGELTLMYANSFGVSGGDSVSVFDYDNIFVRSLIFQLGSVSVAGTIFCYGYRLQLEDI